MLITHSTTGRGSVNQMPRIVSIEEFNPTSPLSFSESPLSSPQITFHCQPPFLSFHISSQCFLFFVFLHSCSHIPASLLAKAQLVQLWFLAIPLRLEQTWTVPRWARTQLAGSVQGWLWSMDGWMDGHGAAGMHSDLFLLMAYSCFALTQPVWTCTNNCCVFCRVCFPQYWSTCPTENAFLSSCFLIQTLNTLIALFFVLSTSL